MDFFTKFSSYKEDSISSSLSSIMLWTAKLPSLLHMSKQSSATLTQHNLQVDLKTQIHSEEAKRPPISTHNPNILHCDTLPRASPGPVPPSSSSLLSSSSSVFQSSVTDDVIGTESGDYMSSSLGNVEGLEKMMEKSEPPTNHRRPRYSNAMMRQYPPPIPLFSQSGNVPGRVPLVFKREVGEDGRLIITVERFQRREYLVAHRENGRLVMDLIPANDAVYCECCGQPLEEDIEFNEEQVASESSRCFMFADGLVRDSDIIGKVHGLGGVHGYLGRPGSAPLRPVTPVMCALVG